MSIADRLRRRADALSPDFKLVLECVRWPRDGARAQAATVRAAAVADWSRVLGIVDRHRVPGLVAHALHAAAVPVPPDIRDSLAARAQAAAVAELVQAAETARLARAFSDASLGLTVVKGTTAALGIYGRLGLRHSVDIDLLVRRANVARAERIVADLGYRRTEPSADAPPGAVRARLDRYKDFAFVHEDKGIALELHWRLFLNPRFMPWVADAATVPMELPGGATVQTLGGDDLALYLCGHGAEHAWSRLKWLADLAAILSGPGGSADALYAAAKARGLARVAGPGLLLSAALLGSALPQALVADADSDARMRRLADIAFTCLVGSGDASELEDLPSGSTRKNLSHYLFTSDIRYLWHEARYDLLDDSVGGHSFGQRLQRLARLLAGRA